MKLNEEKSNYIIFSKAREEFAARLALNEKLLERKKVTKKLGYFLKKKEDGRRTQPMMDENCLFLV